MIFDFGDIADLTVTFKNAAGGPVDPSAAQAVVRPPSGVESVIAYPSANFVKLAAGSYLVSVAVTAAGGSGAWLVQVDSDGAAQGSEPFQFAVRARAVVTPYS